VHLNADDTKEINDGRNAKKDIHYNGQQKKKNKEKTIVYKAQ
jgi:hypothetical protein